MREDVISKSEQSLFIFTPFRMISIYPTSTTFLNELGKIQYLNGLFSDSYDTFTGLQILDPYNQSAAYYLGFIKKK